ncbi:lyase family protein [Nesterenkonia marinintestina]|uniref:lyase family protein n=1 Tax=Nesterenkonia marinintestina TaxID=2979865 RepID=UPI0021C0C30D|nr:lyase family protein [Nesterenkonia sp. GX14115]
MTGQYGLLAPVWADTEAAAATSDEAVVYALLHVEAAWAETLAAADLAPEASARAVRRLCEDQAVPHAAPIDPRVLAAGGVAGGNPVIPLLGEIRRALADRGGSDAALHRGATSQDVLDTAMNLIVRTVAAGIIARAIRICDALAAHAQTHRGTVCVARSLTRHALPTTFGLRAAGWLDGVREAVSALHRAVESLPLQWGGAVGTQAALTDRYGSGGASELTDQLADRLKMPSARPWHTQRRPMLDVGSALTGVVAALGKIAGDVLILQRPEIAELAEPADASRGGSSAMPQKQNPVLSVLLRSAADAAPGHLATLFGAAAAAQDERPDGAWHAEWPAVSELLRLAGGSAVRADELITGLRVFPDRMRETVDDAGEALLSERLMQHLSSVLPGGAQAVQEAVRTSLADGASLRGLIEAQLRSADPNPDREAALDALDDLFDPAQYLGRADEFVDSAVADYQQIRSAWT